MQKQRQQTCNMAKQHFNMTLSSLAKPRSTPLQPLRVYAVFAMHTNAKQTVAMQGMAALPFSALSWRQRIQLVFSRLAQCFRLMVGVHDYQAYVQHVQLHHPEQIPMTEKQFHRHCLDARYPSKAGKLGKCPC